MIGNIQFHKIKNTALCYILNYAVVALRVYSGTPPATANSYTASAYTGSLLITYSLVVNSFTFNASNTAQTYMSTFPAPVAASASGTASWFCLDCTATALAGNYPFLIDGITDYTGNGTLKLTTTSIVSGTAYDIYSLAFEFKQ